MKVALLALCIAATAASAAETNYRAVIDRVELEPAAIGGYRLRVYMSALALQGQTLDLSDSKSIRLYLGSRPYSLPFALGTYDATASDTDIIILVQATSDYADALPMISDAIDHELLSKLPDRARVAITTLDEAARVPKLQTVKSLRGKVALTTDHAANDPPLLDTIDRAMVAVRKSASANPDGAEPSVRSRRKIIVIVGDGRDASGDFDRVTKTGVRAGKAGIRIHTLAYSPQDLRRTLLVLGELSKRSLGTLRWPGQGRKPIAETWNDSFRQLAMEINKQYVVTFFASADDSVFGKRLHIETQGRIETTTNEVPVPGAASCAGNPCEAGYCANDACIAPQLRSKGRAIATGVLAVVGIVVGVAVLLGLIGWWMSKRGGAQPGPQAPHASLQPTANVLPNGRPIPALLLVSGPRAGERFLLRENFTIGKNFGCDLVLDDGFTSGHHAQIAMAPTGRCTLFDRGSTNGTFVNGVQIQQFQLTHGAEIRIGSIEMRFLEQ